MANYNIPTYPSRRLRYYNNQFLKDQDFIDDQAHQLSMAQAQLRSLCVAGVCEGLAIRIDGGKVHVSAGTAVDSAGHLIALDVEKPGPDATTLANGEYQLHIKFFEEEDVMAPPVAGGAQGNTRWTQRPVLDATAKGTALPAGVVALGTFTVAQAAATASSTTGRQYSGLRLPGPGAGAATLTNRSDGSADGALLRGDLTVRRDVPGGKLGPTLSLINGVAYPGGAGSGAAIDLGGYDPGANAPALRIAAIGDNAGSSHLTFSTKAPGPVTNNLVERLRVTSLGVLQFPNEAPKDKIVLYDAAPNDRYGMGLNGGNLNLFYPASGRFSLRQDSSGGTEVLTVTGAGTATFTGAIVPKAGNSAAAGIQFPANPGGGGGDEAFLRYFVVANETTKLMLGINNDPDDALALWQAGAERLTIANGVVQVGSQLAVTGDLHLHGKHAFRGNDSWLRLNEDLAFASGVYTRSLLRVDNDIQIHGRHAFRGSDSWLRLNQDGAFSSGVYTPRLFRVDNDLQLHGKHALRGNDTWLRLNQDGHFAHGVHTPGLFAPNAINVGGAGGWEHNPGGGHVILAGNIGTHGFSPTGGGKHPADWGGGIHTWDVVAEASVGYSALRQWSSIHDKTDISELPDALATLDQLNPIFYERQGGPRAGFIAEEVLEVFERGAEAADGFFAVGINPDALLALAIAAVQELSAQVRELTAERGRGARTAAPPARSIEVLREAEKEGQRYVTARFSTVEQTGAPRSTVRTVRLPAGGDRDRCLEAEYEGWKHRVA